MTSTKHSRDDGQTRNSSQQNTRAKTQKKSLAELLRRPSSTVQKVNDDKQSVDSNIKVTAAAQMQNCNTNLKKSITELDKEALNISVLPLNVKTRSR